MYGSLLVGLGTASGIDPLVAQAYGGSRPTDAGRALIQGSIVVAAVSVPIAAVHWWAGTLLTLLRQPAAGFIALRVRARMHTCTDGRNAQIVVRDEKQKYPNHEACHMLLSRSNSS